MSLYIYIYIYIYNMCMHVCIYVCIKSKQSPPGALRAWSFLGYSRNMLKF